MKCLTVRKTDGSGLKMQKTAALCRLRVPVWARLKFSLCSTRYMFKRVHSHFDPANKRGFHCVWPMSFQIKAPHVFLLVSHCFSGFFSASSVCGKSVLRVRKCSPLPLLNAKTSKHGLQFSHDLIKLRETSVSVWVQKLFLTWAGTCKNSRAAEAAGGVFLRPCYFNTLLPVE